jgi:Ca2+-binding EF-hand superfamily protein
MESSEVDRLLKNVKISNEGKINYNTFVDYLLKA